MFVESKRAMIDARHQYLFSSVAAKLGMVDAEVEEAMLDGDQVTTNSSTMRIIVRHCWFTHAPTGDYNYNFENIYKQL